MDLDDGTIKGRHLVAQSLKAAGIEYVFGVVGYPVIELGFAIQNVGLKYIGMRNEQAASYAAAAYGYLTGKPACCLVVPGPGVIHALAGMANACSNGWPMLCIAGSSELEQNGLGAFQESLPPQGGSQMQIMYAAPMSKYTVKVAHPERIPFAIEQAIRYAKHGRPGASYVEIAGDTLRDPLDTKKLDIDGLVKQIYQSDVRISLAPQEDIERSLKVLREAKKPLMIVGKGAAYSDASGNCLEFVKRTGIPFLPTPMGKGVIPDDHELCCSSARSFVLKEADVILLVGARLNWILHYGLPPRFSPNVKFIHIEILPEEVDAAKKCEVGLVGNAKAIVGQLVNSLGKVSFTVDKKSSWIKSIEKNKSQSVSLFNELMNDRTSPMNYYCALGIVNSFIPSTAIVVNEGSDTMDIGRTMLLNSLPKKRLDAGSWGTMGVGMGQSIAAALVRLDECRAEGKEADGVFFVCGDSAFGFSAVEFEVVTRYQLPVIVVIINNNGIGPWNPDDYLGLETHEQRLTFPAKSLAPKCHYEKIGEAFGAKGVFVETADELEQAMKEATKHKPYKPMIINCMISTTASRGKPAAPPFAKTGKL